MLNSVVTYRDGEAGRHPVKVVGVATHSDNLGDDLFVCPLDTKDFGELLQVLCAGFSDAEDGVTKPRHAEAGEFLVEKVDTELRGEKWEMLDDCQPHTPLLVLGELDDCR